MTLTRTQVEALLEYESLFTRIVGSKQKYPYISKDKKNKLKQHYLSITSKSTCTGCNSYWIVRLATWYIESKKLYRFKKIK